MKATAGAAGRATAPGDAGGGTAPVPARQMIGTFAVQIAKALGTQVTGVCSTAKTDLVTSIGAGHVLDYTRDDFADGSQRCDLLLDVAGNSPLDRLRRALTPAGTLVLAGGEDGGRWTGMSRQLRALAGQLTPVIGKTYPLRHAPDAMRHLQGGHARGQLVLTTTDAG